MQPGAVAEGIDGYLGQRVPKDLGSDMSAGAEVIAATTRAVISRAGSVRTSSLVAKYRKKVRRPIPAAPQISATVTWQYSTVAARLSTRLRSRRSVMVPSAGLTVGWCWFGGGQPRGQPCRRRAADGTICPDGAACHVTASRLCAVRQRPEGSHDRGNASCASGGDARRGRLQRRMRVAGCPARSPLWQLSRWPA